MGCLFSKGESSEGRSRHRYSNEADGRGGMSRDDMDDYNRANSPGAEKPRERRRRRNKTPENT